MKLLLIMAQTADGIIARSATHYPDWTGPADKRMFKQVTQAAGVVIMGARTYAAIGKPLPGRLNVVYTRHPQRIAPAPDLLLTGKAPALLLEDLAGRGYAQAVLAGGATLNTLFMQAGVIDEILLTIAPRLFGQGLGLFAGALDVHLDLIDTRKLDSHTMVLHYRVLKSAR